MTTTIVVEADGQSDPVQIGRGPKTIFVTGGFGGGTFAD